MVRDGEQMPWDVSLQLQLRLKRGLSTSRESHPSRHTKDMGIDRHNLLPP